MTRSQLEHLLRAAWGITGAERFVIVGSQAVLGTQANPPPELDLAVSKLVAGRDRDLSYVEAIVRHDLVDPRVVEQRLGMTPINEEQRTRCLARLQRFTDR